MRTTAAVTAIVLSLLLAGCGGGGHAGHDGAQQVAEPVDGAVTVDVAAVDIDFTPATLRLVAGEPVNVTVTNEGEALHDFTLEAAGVHVNVEPGQSLTTSVVIDEPGHYEAKCTVTGHAEAGMTIDVVVT